MVESRWGLSSHQLLRGSQSLEQGSRLATMLASPHSFVFLEEQVEYVIKHGGPLWEMFYVVILIVELINNS